jgi:hypothetical protein
MADTLDDIRKAWEKRDARGQRSSSGRSNVDDDQNVYKMADAYVKAHKADFAGFENLSLDALVKMIEERRDRGDDEEMWKLQVWEWHRFDRQNIGGTYEPKLRSSNG